MDACQGKECGVASSPLSILPPGTLGETSGWPQDPAGGLVVPGVEPLVLVGLEVVPVELVLVLPVVASVVEVGA